MVDKDLLDTFKKHLNGIDDSHKLNLSGNCFNKERKIHKFGEDMKSANEFIGALQILDNALSKLLVQIQVILIDDEFKDGDFKSLEGIVFKEISEIVEKCSFMGTPLFGNTLSIFVDTQEIVIEIFNPLDFLENGGYENVCSYLEDKKAEIADCLKLVALKASGQQIFDSDLSSTSSYDNFDAKDFLKML
ncbi:hypothetical protein BKH42_00130 [Helicobacter sp. 13S00482-2]|uniref:flagellar FLiS export co-chaperone n=1 Tax=Helicobacter sp. 13S00482-2 TaxID=1476200 RepID=UPI000BA629A7|nr:flagellar FLiS export co-chaperone [Helicobacter sp. 13S00482-2]PAF54362.1 hypothetical protein BKH42_00130 [Helicobacter sp. 13S00482-2]